MWRALDPPPFIYLTAITLDPEATAEELADVRGTLCDSWSRIELESLGFREQMREPWFVRPPGELDPEDAPAELVVVEVATPDEVAEFELASARGFGSEDATVETTFHPPSILGDERMRMLTGRVEGKAVAAAMSFRAEAATGIYGVTTLASARGRGYATALTRALLDPARPTVLSPSREAERLYRRLGFEQVGGLRQWTSGREQA